MRLHEFLTWFGLYIVSGTLFIITLLIELTYVHIKYSERLPENEKNIRDNALFINTFNAHNKLKTKTFFIILLWPYYAYHIFDILEQTKKIYKPEESTLYINESNMNLKKTVVSMLWRMFVEANLSRMIDETQRTYIDNERALLMEDCEHILKDNLSINEINNIVNKYK